MPIYEYRCTRCGATFEKIIFSKTAPPPACPKCGFETADKLISVPGAVGVSSSKAQNPASCPAAASGQCGSGFT